MNCGKLATNWRLKHLYAMLKEKPATSREIRDWCDTCAPATLVSELRHNDIRVKCELVGKSPVSGNRIYRYRLVD